jgi:hypothetical protein
MWAFIAVVLVVVLGVVRALVMYAGKNGGRNDFE